jgi:two-component system response regulator FlrC
LNHILEILPACVIVLDPKGKISYCNTAAKTFFETDLIGLSWFDFITTKLDKACDDGLSLLLKSGKIISLDTQSLHPDPGQVLLIQEFTKTREQLFNKFNEMLSANAKDLILEDEQSKKIFDIAKRVAKTEVTVLIFGESGTGKEVLAQFIHQNSSRIKGPFVAINCAAIPDNMLESLLFGHEKGAFTGAYQSSAGKFEQAQDGTILLDEISELPLSLQAKLLRVLQEQVVERIGGKKEIKLNVRILATTNRSLEEMVLNGTFREDLFYRLNVFPLTTMPLRDRKGDILPIADHLLKNKNPSPDYKFLSEAAKEKLLNYSWPGNIRELQNVLARAMILSLGSEIKESDLELNMNKNKEQKTLGALKEQTEQERILQALKETKGKRQAAAKLLDISERTLRYKLAKLKENGIEFPCQRRINE